MQDDAGRRRRENEVSIEGDAWKEKIGERAFTNENRNDNRHIDTTE